MLLLMPAFRLDIFLASEFQWPIGTGYKYFPTGNS